MKFILLSILILNFSLLFSQSDQVKKCYSEIEKLDKKDIPICFDLRNYNRTSPVRIQPDGGCWASAAMSTVESAWLTADYKDVNLSSVNLKLFHGFVDERSANGNHYMSNAYFTRWSGPIKSSPELDSIRQPYPESAIIEARYLPEDPDLIKSVIIKTGGTFSMMYFNQSKFDTANNTYCSIQNEINHAVMLIGWNDTLVVNNKAGAWLAQNSLGEKFGDQGFFWISYQDENILKYNAVWNGWMDYNSQSSIYYYDTLGSFYSYGFRDTICYGLVKYTAIESLKIEAIGTSINFPDSKVEAWIFKEFDDSLKILSEPVGKTNPMNCDYLGYYTLSNQDYTEFKKGEDFYIMMKYVTPNDTLPLPVETIIDGYSKPLLTSGKCWINPDYGKWPTTWYECGAVSPFPTLKFNLCIKAYCTRVN